MGEYSQQICHVERYAVRPARFVPLERLTNAEGLPLLPMTVLRALSQDLGINQFFEHQVAALKAVLSNRQHLCLTTGTSSGKSLAFALPILEEYRKDPSARALIIFPTKALAQDQLSKLRRL